MEINPPECHVLVKLDLKVNGVKSEALIHTGAATNFINRKFVESNEIQLTLARSRLSTHEEIVRKRTNKFYMDSLVK